MNEFSPQHLIKSLQGIRPARRLGKVTAIQPGAVRVSGLGATARMGDQVTVGHAPAQTGEIVALAQDHAVIMPYGDPEGMFLGASVTIGQQAGIRPDESWIGRIVDAFGQPLDQRPLPQGPVSIPIRRQPPAAAVRKALGPRLRTGLAVFDTLLPIALGQRIGVFSGSGVGKSSLLADLACGLAADVVVLALIGERGRELRDFVENVLGPQGMARTVLVVATSDQSPLIKRRAAWVAMAVAEWFRDGGKHVLLIADSLTRFAEAHREVALTGGETPSLRAFPPSTANLIAAFAERAGPGAEGQGDITAVFSVLVAGSDMEEPVADMVRGVLDGHVVLDRAIAERGRFPAVDVRRSVSRSLPGVASVEENASIAQIRAVLGTWFDAEMMIQTGLYPRGSDPAIDRAIALWPAIDAFCAAPSADVANSFGMLGKILDTIGKPVSKA